MSDIKKIRERVSKALERIRPYLQSDGGDIELMEVTDGPYSMQTLKAGVEQAIMKEVPEIKRVVSA
ncbi:MAG: nitrogen-fixing NifU domain protein [Bacteroidetes bacterium]|nr:nitrogen-fixing NifU domain protein [Bacteroidota bacterium]